MALATLMDRRAVESDREQVKLQALSVFRQRIEIFRESVAEEAGRSCWQKLSTELYLEQFRPCKVVRYQVADALDQMGMNISIWDDVRQIAEAAFDTFPQGKPLHPAKLKRMVTLGGLGEDLQSCNASMLSMLDWLSILV